jgi:hypothetical protein
MGIDARAKKLRRNVAMKPRSYRHGSKVMMNEITQLEARLQRVEARHLKAVVELGKCSTTFDATCARIDINAADMLISKIQARLDTLLAL